MSTLTPESITGEQPMRIRPVYSHDRTIITLAILILGALLLAMYGDATPIVALVTSAWTLVLTFWFRTRDEIGNGKT